MEVIDSINNDRQETNKKIFQPAAASALNQRRRPFTDKYHLLTDVSIQLRYLGPFDVDMCVVISCV